MARASVFEKGKLPFNKMLLKLAWVLPANKGHTILLSVLGTFFTITALPQKAPV
jgi:hypothetical protein